MRTHIQIIEDAGGYQAMAGKLGLDNERVRFWRRREAIPPDQWGAVAEAGFATLDELVTAPKPTKAHGATQDQGASA